MQGLYMWIHTAIQERPNFRFLIKTVVVKKYL